MRRKEDGRDYERVYVGSQNETEAGEACIDWAEVTEDFFPDQETRGHNYCRNPGGEEDREFCYVDQTHRGFCAVKTCGDVVLHLRIFIYNTVIRGRQGPSREDGSRDL